MLLTSIFLIEGNCMKCKQKKAYSYIYKTGFFVFNELNSNQLITRLSDKQLLLIKAY